MFVGGKTAIQLFYVISGFLITHILRTNRAYERPTLFYLNRALRIYPIYFAVAAFTLLSVAIGNPKFFEFYRRLGAGASALLFLSNSLLFGQDWVMFSAQKGGHLQFAMNFSDSDPPLFKGLLIPQAWTLGLELTFYAIAPFVVRKPRVVVALLVLSVAVRIYLFQMGLAGQDPWSYRFFPAELALFLFGSLSKTHLLPKWEAFVEHRKHLNLPRLATFGLTLLVASYFIFPINEAAKAVFLFSFFILLLPGAFLYQATSSMDKAIGELGYPIYMGHMLAIWTIGVAFHRVHVELGSAGASIINVLAAIAFAFVLNWSLGGRIEKFRARIRATSA